MGRKLLREPQVLERVGFGKTKFEEDYVKTGKVTWVRIGERIKALPEDEVDRLVDEIIAERDAALKAQADPPASPPAKPKQPKTTKASAGETAKRRARAST